MYDFDYTPDEARQDYALEMLECDSDDIEMMYDEYIKRKEGMSGPSMSTYMVSY